MALTVDFFVVDEHTGDGTRIGGLAPVGPPAGWAYEFSQLF
ncbi:hypothetical protein [Cuneatibacter sp. NSJ-177]|nr:hypothetical protein [Cuneatibacter sp. NSJ-177]